MSFPSHKTHLKVVKTNKPSEQPVYGWFPKGPIQSTDPIFPQETWLISQAKSYLGREVTFQEAQELFSRIDVNTREPIQPVTPPSRLRRFLVRLLGA